MADSDHVVWMTHPSVPGRVAQVAPGTGPASAWQAKGWSVTATPPADRRPVWAQRG